MRISLHGVVGDNIILYVYYVDQPAGGLYRNLRVISFEDLEASNLANLVLSAGHLPLVTDLVTLYVDKTTLLCCQLSIYSQPQPLLYYDVNTNTHALQNNNWGSTEVWGAQNRKLFRILADETNPQLVSLTSTKGGAQTALPETLVNDFVQVKNIADGRKYIGSSGGVSPNYLDCMYAYNGRYYIIYGKDIFKVRKITRIHAYEEEEN